jgi:tryptophan halogenase
MINEDVKHVVVVGGGTAGWLTAGVLAAKCVKEQGRDLKITLIESSAIGTIGVGEGTWPSLRTTLQTMGISETEFIRKCDATFKQGACFKKWIDNSEDDFYYHPLMLPANLGPLNSVIRKLNNDSSNHGLSYSNMLCSQEAVCERGLAPKDITTPEYQGILNYAYHLDTNKFSVFIKEHCISKLNINHVVNDIVGTTMGDDGEVGSLRLADGTELAGDFYIDCSGFAGLLIDKHFKIPFLDKSDILFCDRAVAVQCPYAEQNAAIASHTISTATGSGWIWDIGLQKRRGVGHVYSSRYMNEDDAERDLRKYVGKQMDELDIRHIKYKPGHREKFWVKNCVAVGLAAGFVEPLEASSILLVEISAYWIAEKFPHKKIGFANCEKQFNETFSYRWDTIIEFLKLHYCISRRTDTDFWRDNTHPNSIPAALVEKLNLWREQCPSVVDFLNRADVFPFESYCYILYGMKFKTATYAIGDIYLNMLEKKIHNQQRNMAALINSLPGNRALMNKICEYGLQRI